MYFMRQILFKNDGTFDKGTTSYESADDAEAAYHQALVSVISKKATYFKAIVDVIDENDIVVNRLQRVWAKETTEE